MDKEQLLQELSIKVANGELAHDEIVQRLGLTQMVQPSHDDTIETKESHYFSVTKMLYVLGAGIVVIGIIIFMAQVWDDMGSFGHIIITLGLGLLVTLLGSMLLNKESKTKLGTVFHFIGGMLIPGGVAVTLDEMSLATDWSFALVFIGVFIFYLILNAVHKNAILTFFAIANGTAAIYLVLNAVIGGPISGFFEIESMYEYLTMAIGASYMLLAYSFKDGWNSKLIGTLNFFGITGLLGVAFIQVFDSGAWELLYFLVVFGTLFLSVYLKSRIILIMSTLFLIAHVTYITSEYFADSLGWPVALVLLGFVFIGLGYASITINNKYIKQ
jgi:hypothetical protein